jgi:hypothetical protein
MAQAWKSPPGDDRRASDIAAVVGDRGSQEDKPSTPASQVLALAWLRSRCALLALRARALVALAGIGG